MNATRQRAIRLEARKLLVQLWNRRKDFWTDPPDAEEFVRQAPEIIVTHLLSLSLEKPEQIDLAPTTPAGLEAEVAGYVDRNSKRIVVAQKFPLEWRRFTIAHEIAHWILHPELVNHRDRIVTGGERANHHRPQTEQEADLFAAELLMPNKLLTKVFLQCFGGAIDGSSPDENLAFHLSPASGRRLDGQTLANMEPRHRAMLAAKATTFGSRFFVPLHRRFKVSPTAMAIQLVDLRLVK